MGILWPVLPKTSFFKLFIAYHTWTCVFSKEIWFKTLSKVKSIILWLIIFNSHWYLYRITEEKWPLCPPATFLQELQPRCTRAQPPACIFYLFILKNLTFFTTTTTNYIGFSVLSAYQSRCIIFPPGGAFYEPASAYGR